MQTTKLNSRSYCDDIKRVLATSNFSSFDDLTTALNQCKNRHLQTVSHTHTVNPYKPWLDDKFFSLLNERNRYYQLKKKSPTNGYLRDKYLQICEMIKSKRVYLRSNFNSNLINKHLNNPKKMWAHLNEIIYNSKRSKTPISTIMNNDNVTTTNKVLQIF